MLLYIVPYGLLLWVRSIVNHILFVSICFIWKGLLIRYLCPGGSSMVDCCLEYNFEYCMRNDNADTRKRVWFAPTITICTIQQNKQEMRDNRASYARVSLLIYISEVHPIVPADDPYVPRTSKKVRSCLKSQQR